MNKERFNISNDNLSFVKLNYLRNFNFFHFFLNILILLLNFNILFNIKLNITAIFF